MYCRMLQESILQYVRPSLSYHLPLRPLFCIFLSGRLRQVLLYSYFIIPKKIICRILTHLSLIEFPTLINWTSPILFLGLLVDILHFYSNFDRTFCKLTMENLIRCRMLRHLIWLCTVCQCPTKRTLGLYGLSSHIRKRPWLI